MPVLETQWSRDTSSTCTSQRSFYWSTSYLFLKSFCLIDQSDWLDQVGMERAPFFSLQALHHMIAMTMDHVMRWVHLPYNQPRFPAIEFFFLYTEMILNRSFIYSSIQDSPVMPIGRSPRTDLLLKSEKIVIEFGGCVLRLAGLYKADRGAHSYWLEKGTVDVRPDHILNLIHYEVWKLSFYFYLFCLRTSISSHSLYYSQLLD